MRPITFYNILISLAFAICSGPAWATHTDIFRYCQNLLAPDRAKLQQQWLDRSRLAVQKLSDHIARREGTPDRPLLLLTRGNSGSGKSWILANGELPLLRNLKLKEYFSVAGQDGILNPDTIKQWIQQNDGSSSQNSHEEGSTLAKQLIAETIARGSNLIVDKRFLSLDSISDILSNAKKKSYRIVLLDVDATLDASVLRIGSREIGGQSPNVPFDSIQDGFVQSRKNRLSFVGSRDIDEYYLFSNGKLIARRLGENPVEIQILSEWKQLTTAPREEQMATDKNLYAALLNFLSQTLPNSFMRPYHAHLAAPPLAPAQVELYPEKAAVHYLYYQIYKTGDMNSHQLLGETLVRFFNRTYPDLKIQTSFVPEQTERMADYRITISSADSDLLRRLLHDSFWKPVVEVRTDGIVSLQYSTRRIGKRPAGVSYVDYDDLVSYMPGESAPDMGLAAKHFILFGEHQGTLPEMPPDVRAVAKVRVRFSTAFADAHHNSGFHLRQIPAALFAAQVEHYQLKKELSTEKQVCEYVKEAFQYLAWTELALQGNPAFQLIGSSSSELAKVDPWLRKQKSVLEALQSQVHCKL